MGLTPGCILTAGMDRALWEEHLALAERHVAQGERIIGRQHEVVAKLECFGHDATQAWNLLRVFQESQAIHIADRDRLRKELGLGQPEI